MENKEKTALTADKIKALAAEIGISDTGICGAEADPELLLHLPADITPFVAPAAQRIAPAVVLPGAKSVIVCAFHYAQPLPDKANISRYVWGQDYHIVVKDYLARLLSEIQKHAPQATGYIFTDSSPLCDKALAYRAGLGYFGKNSLLLHPRFGSLFFIGGIVTNLDLDTDTPKEGDCGTCTACSSACPAGLCGTGQLHGKKCISYLQQKKGNLTEEEAALIRKSGSAWGCDLCQNACPKNHLQPQTTLPEFSVIDTILPYDLTEEAFNTRYQNRAFHWRGYAVIRRNLELIKEKETPPLA